MNPELALYNQELRTVLSDLAQAVQGINGDKLDTSPLPVGTNSPVIIVTHVLGNCAAWVLGLAFDREMKRNRAEEFEAKGVSTADLVARLNQLVEEIDQACAIATNFDGDAQIRPRQDLFGSGTARGMTRREAIVHALVHANEHLGELRLTAVLLQARS